MADIFDEVEGEYRAEQLRKAALRYAWVGVAIVVAALLAGGGYEYWQARTARAAAQAATGYIDLAKSADAVVVGDSAGGAAVAKRFDAFAATAPAGYRSLARLREAALLADAGQLAAAQTVWDRVATDPATDALLRQLAALLWVQRSLDSADPAALRTRLIALTAGDSAFRALGLEAQAMLDLRLDQPDAARAVLRLLAADPATPENGRARAGALLTRLGG